MADFPTTAPSLTTEYSDNNAKLQQHQCQHRNHHEEETTDTNLSSLEGFLFLPQLPVNGDDGSENEKTFLFKPHEMQLEQRHETYYRQKRLLSTNLLTTLKTGIKKTKSDRISSSLLSSSIRNPNSACNTIFLTDQDGDDIDDRKESSMRCCCYTDAARLKLPLNKTNTKDNLDDGSNYVNATGHICGKLDYSYGKHNSLYPPLATTNGTVRVSTNSLSDANKNSNGNVYAIKNEKSGQQHEQLSSTNILINKNCSSDCSNSRNHNHSSPFSFASNHHQRNHPHLHQYLPHHYHRRRWLIFRVCQVFAVLLSVLFLSYLVKASIWASEEYKSRIGAHSSYSRLRQSSSSFTASKDANSLIQTWNMPSIKSQTLSSSSATFEDPKVLSGLISSSKNNNGSTNDESRHNLLLDVPNFKFLMNNSTKCKIPRDADNYIGEDDGAGNENNDKAANTIFFMIIVHSAPQNVLVRQVIRETWGSLQRVGQFHVRLVFLLGQDELALNKGYHRLTSNNNLNESRQNNFLYSKIQRESQEYGDIVTGNFHDTYRNLTYKHLMGYLWLLNHCPHAKYVLKADDDAFIDIVQLYKFVLRTFGTESKSGTLICNVFEDNTKPVRSSDVRGKKWAVSYEEYPLDAYPKYCGGLAYLATPDVIREIYYMSRKAANKFLWIDDVYVTGILRKLAQVEPFYLNLRYAYDPEEYRKWLAVKMPPKENNNGFGAVSKFKNEWKPRKTEVSPNSTTSEAVSNAMINERRSFLPQKLPFMIVHVERGPHLVREMKELWNKTVTVWSGSRLAF